MGMKLTALELCAGGGGQALGLEMAGFHCAAAIEIEPQCCATLRLNRPHWNVIEDDIRQVSGWDHAGVDLLAAGVPCPPFSVAGKQLGADDDRDMFPAVLRLVEEAKPAAVLIENVPGLASIKFARYRRRIIEKLAKLGYQVDWKILNASEFGVPQLRPRFLLVGLRQAHWDYFRWPEPVPGFRTVGESLRDLMSAHGWPGVSGWVEKANRTAPTIVGGSKKHGGPDLGPTRAKLQWGQLGVDGMGIADDAPHRDFPKDGRPRLTVRMVARLQTFPDEWNFSGRKTVAYRQVGNALPPFVARAIGLSLANSLNKRHVLASMKMQLELRMAHKAG